MGKSQKLNRKSKKKLTNKKLTDDNSTEVIEEDDIITDKFCILWCCKDFFVKHTKKWDIKMLYETELGHRYFTKFESQEEKISRMCAKVLQNTVVWLSDAKSDKSIVNHSAFVLKEEYPHCISMFSHYFNGSCSEKTCNIPRLTVHSKLMCLLMTCIRCTKEDCPAKTECHEFVAHILELYSMEDEMEETEIMDIYIKVFTTMKINYAIHGFLCASDENISDEHIMTLLDKMENDRYVYKERMNEYNNVVKNYKKMKNIKKDK